jgi:hypothetical protein
MLEVAKAAETLDPAQAQAMHDWSDRIWRELAPWRKPAEEGV